MSMDYRTRRAAVVTIVAAAATGVQVYDDEPDTIPEDVAIVVAWVATDRDRTQWTHTLEVRCIATAHDAIATADAIAVDVLRALDAAQGLGRPSARPGDIAIGGTVYERCPIITITATDQPISS